MVWRHPVNVVADVGLQPLALGTGGSCIMRATCHSFCESCLRCYVSYDWPRHCEGDMPGFWAQRGKPCRAGAKLAPLLELLVALLLRQVLNSVRECSKFRLPGGRTPPNVHKPWWEATG